jgi:hypothetical protein
MSVSCFLAHVVTGLHDDGGDGRNVGIRGVVSRRDCVIVATEVDGSVLVPRDADSVAGVIGVQKVRH